ncbi:MAG: hypothetical protein HQK87_01845 [Nitrospinae bacterium]|nr:hypothetical protein [Nitrospinota bacterium]
MTGKIGRLAGALLLFAVAFSVGNAVAQSKGWGARLVQEQLLSAPGRTETRPTLDPALFSSHAMVEAAYAAARAIPETLDRIYCYCHCALNPRFKHKSLLTCYVDDHGAGCGICMRQALAAQEMKKQGIAPEEMARRFAEQYAPLQDR